MWLSLEQAETALLILGGQVLLERGYDDGGLCDADRFPVAVESNAKSRREPKRHRLALRRCLRYHFLVAAWFHRGTSMQSMRRFRQAENAREWKMRFMSHKKTSVIVNTDLEEMVRAKGVALRLYNWQDCVERALQEWVAPPSTAGLDPRVARIAEILSKPGNLETFRRILLTVVEDPSKL